ncbi:DUF4181 domain-containing protein [Schinkia azotoformans]|uniref:DUF4181 domain-containing protein n=1 Tax=Schinkia azotoformans LMG 9581 TaxID=1131731 RepID=K6BXQ3_SCHAZ|nr:DUF4181 domain-containing protein [Schinkia azotoformans]EKN63700.1 hypothetical protein BAZO_16299 [Schinkia azotoformans LMG 9581]MEC1640881.1 DUF4181 domain-containing protein [Schinkia azotoformans]MEC1947333.1 DUF4181 domain-containing protein [Schinkia azotoformans]
MISFVIVAFIVLVSIKGAKLFLRKVLHIEKDNKKFFSYNHINERHRKVDKAVRTASTIIFIILLYFLYFENYSITFFLTSVIIFAVIDYVVQAYFEWRYSDKPKQSILTIAEMLLWLIALIVIIQLDLFSK